MRRLGTGGPSFLVAAGLALAPGAVPATAQQGPPDPLPMAEFELPPFQEGVLPNGARVLVVTQREVPFVTVNLVLPGGRAADPPERAGLAALTAGLLTKGTGSRSADEIEEAVDFLGAGLGATTGIDWTTVSVEAVTSALPEMLELMADVVLSPTFPVEEVESLRLRAVSGLRASLEQPATLADRAFLRAAYGDHPYGRLETTASLESIDRAAVADFHRTWYRPGRALIVLAGDVELETALPLLEDAFSEWAPGSPPEVVFGAPPTREAPRIVVVHQPGAVQAVVRIGHLLARGDDRDWTPLTTLNQVLGGGPTGRLFRILREEKGLTYAAYSQAERRLDRGVFRAYADGRTEVAAGIVEELLAQVVRVRDETIGPEELADARDFLVGSFPLQVETPQQLAGHLTTGRLLGLPDSALATYRERVAALGPEDLRRVAAEHLHPAELVLVVVGDATGLMSRLTTFGRVEVVDADGQPLDLADLLPGDRTIALDASGLRPTTLEYDVGFQGRSVGTLTRSLEPGETPGTMVYRGTADMGGQTVSQSVTFSVSDFQALGAEARIEAPGQAMSMAVEVVEGRLVGQVEGPGQTAPVDRPLPAGAVLGDMVELVLWIADLAEGVEFQVPLVQVETGAVHNAPYRVTGTEEVTVPAGTFRTWRVEMGGPQPQTVWVREEAPHVLVRVEPTSQPVVIQLTSLGVLGG